MIGVFMVLYEAAENRPNHNGMVIARNCAIKCKLISIHGYDGLAHTHTLRHAHMECQLNHC